MPAPRHRKPGQPGLWRLQAAQSQPRPSPPRRAPSSRARASAARSQAGGVPVLWSRTPVVHVHVRGARAPPRSVGQLRLEERRRGGSVEVTANSIVCFYAAVYQAFTL